MTLRKVSPGQPFRMSAEAFNAFIDAATAFQASRQGFGSDGTNTARQPGIIPVRNDTGADQERFAILGLGDVLISPADNLQQFTQGIAFHAVSPDADTHGHRFCVLQEPIAAGSVGRAMIFGVTPVHLAVSAAEDATASVVTGETGHLLTGAEGTARILWAEPGVGEQWGIIQFPTGGSAGSDPNLVLSVTSASHGWMIGDVLRWDGAGWVFADAAQIDPSETLAVVGRIPDADTALLVLWGICCLDDLSPHTDYWLDPTVPGSLTAQKPTTHPRLVLHATEGRLCIVGAGNGGGATSATAFADLTDVDVTTTPPTDGQAAIWDDAQQLWKPGDVIRSEPVAPHQVLIGPISAPGAVPDFRLLEMTDLPDVPATSVIGNATTATGKPTALEAAVDDRVLIRSAGTLQWLVISTAAIGDKQVTDAKIGSLAWGKITGTPATFPPSPHDHLLGGDLTGTTSAAQIAPGAVDAPELADGAVTLAKIAPIVGPSVLGRAAGTGVPEALFPGGDGVVLRQQGGDLGFGLLDNASIADGADIDWAKIDTSTADPSDIGAAAEDHRHALTDLTDVAIVAPTIGQVLVWNATLAKWQNDDPDTGSGIMGPQSVWANPTGAPAEGMSLAAGADNQVLMRMSGTLQFVDLPPSTLGDRSACSVIGRAADSGGVSADISTATNDTVLMRVNDSLQWLDTAPRMKFGNSASGRIQFLGSTGFVTHEYESINSVQAWKQTVFGRTRFYTNGADYWEFARNGNSLELSGWVAGVQTHRLSLSATGNLSGASRTLSLREIDVCENGVAKKMAVLASVPY